MWKLVAFLIGMVVMLIFAGFNYSNISNISLGFYVFKDVPIFISLLVAFVGGDFFCPSLCPQRRPLRQEKTGKGVGKILHR